MARVDHSLFGAPNRAAKAYLQQKRAGFDPPQVITATDLDGIKRNTTKQHSESSSSSLGQNQPNHKTRMQLKQLSDARRAKWPNTLEAQREAKMKARKDRLAQQEEARQALDREEEALQMEKRRLAIERAQRILYENTDRSKALKTQMLLTDVMMENKLMMDLQSSMRASEAAEDKAFAAMEAEKLRLDDLEEAARAERKAAALEETRRLRLNQLSERESLKAAEAAERASEAVAMRVAVAAAERATEAEHAALLARQAAVRQNFIESNEALLAHRAVDAARIKAEDARMRKYAKAKEKDLLERRAREEQRFADRQAWRQQLIDKQVAQLTNLNAEADTRLKKQEMEVTEKANEARKRLDEKKKDELLITHMSRQQQMRWKAEKRVQEQYADAYFAEQQRLLNDELLEEQADELVKKYEDRKAYDKILFKQMEAKKQRQREERLTDMKEAEETKQWMGDDDAIYENYARMSLAEYVAEGKDPRPVQYLIRKQLRGGSVERSQ